MAEEASSTNLVAERDMRNHPGEYLAAVANGEEVEVRKRNAPLARVVPTRRAGAIAPSSVAARGASSSSPI